MQQQNAVSKVLVIAAHPDDIEFGAAGSVAVWTDAGLQVTYCLVTDGSAGSNDPNVDRTALIECRRQEQLRAAECVGVTDVRFLGYTDGMLTPSLELRRDLTRVIRQLRPERVVLMDPTIVLVEFEQFHYINHPDHRAAGEAALYAVFPSAETRPIFPELLDEGLEPHHVTELWMMMSDKPNTFIDVSAVHERKLASLLCHASQLDEQAAQMVRGWDAEIGKRVNMPYAEEFRVLRFPTEPPAAEPT